MATEEITLRVDPEAAKLYREASEEWRRKYDLFLTLKIKELARPHRPLEQIMAEMSEEARRNGLTPEILESILNER